MNDREFLNFMYERLVYVHKENELYDYMQRFREIIDRVTKQGVQTRIDIKKKPFIKPEGITIKELKQILSNLPETNQDGLPFKVWVETEIGRSSPVKSVWALNYRVDSCDVLLEHSTKET